MQFYVNGVSVGVDTTAPFGVTWTPTAVGTFVVTAVATDTLGSGTTSVPASVSVIAMPAGPTITTHPVTQTVAPGGSLTLSVTASGSGTLTYQWSRNGVAVAGATNASYTIGNAQLADAGRGFLFSKELKCIPAK